MKRNYTEQLVSLHKMCNILAVFIAEAWPNDLEDTEQGEKSFMMSSSNENISRVTGPLCEEFTGPGEFPAHKGQWRGALMFSLICAWINDWVNKREAGDLRRHRGHYDVNVMITRDAPSYTSDRLCHISTQDASGYRAARKMCSTLVIFIAKLGPNLAILSNVLACDKTCHPTV